MANHPYTDLAKFGYKQNKKEKEFKHPYTFFKENLVIFLDFLEIWATFFFQKVIEFVIPSKKFTKFTRVQNSALKQKGRNALKVNGFQKSRNGD